jgi:hypothetical protein
VTTPRVALAASACALLFGALHAAWALAYFYFPAFGRLTLGPTFDWSFGRPAFRAYDLIVAVLFVAAAALPLAPHRPWGARVPRWVIVAGLWTAAALLGLRGAVLAAADLLVVFGIVDATLTRWVVYDVWFLLLGILFVVAARQLRRRATGAVPAVPSSEPAR